MGQDRDATAFLIAGCGASVASGNHHTRVVGAGSAAAVCGVAQLNELSFIARLEGGLDRLCDPLAGRTPPFTDLLVT